MGGPGCGVVASMTIASAQIHLDLDSHPNGKTLVLGTHSGSVAAPASPSGSY
jgi:hypothetical protein